ncbi:serine protease persephone-like [Pectinophora gossypiella]|uniref:trypsin n=2 Tax=Pectinophora gossypiella TaxID=13191 RepID=A0A1E1WR09_PECGO|nr:serine protease persephone-like [Pectinophora gossypiella]XP_049873335.1 serine protease persephone-like [Pectinophora gossypiella]
MMALKQLILCYFLHLYVVFGTDVGDECVPNNSISEGICTLMTDCEEAVRSVKNRNYHQFQRCGFSGDQEVVCCPQTSEKYGSTDSPTRQSERVADRECKDIIKNSIPPLDLHIIGGELASVGEFPHMVAIGFDRGNGYEFDCGGSLVSRNYVLTAAHCIDTLDRIEPSMVRAGVVELGSNTWNDQTDYRIAEIKLYPSYTRREKYHDLALLRLQRPVKLSSYLNAACLYTSADDPTTPLTVTGWGSTSATTDKRSSSLLKANVSAVSRERCSESYNVANYRKLPRGISAEQLCAGDPDGLHDTCQGDSGGPLQQLMSTDGQYRLVGITSFGRGCGSPVPGVYTRVSHYLDWIEDTVWPR